MNRTKQYRWGILLIAAGTCLAGSPASAQDAKYQSRYDSVERASNYSRRGVGYVYRYAGTRACGYSCGRAAERGGHYIYDRSREWSNRNGQRLQDFGRRTRERIRDRRRR